MGAPPEGSIHMVDSGGEGEEGDPLEEFAKIVSHDLRGHLNVLSGYLSKAEKTGEEEDLEVCHETVDRMEDFVDQIASMAQDTPAEWERTDIQIRDVAADIWEGIEAGSGGLSIEIDASETVSADKFQLEQIIRNLFRNSVEHAEDGVSVYLLPVRDEDGGLIGMRVEDDGPGIPESEREDIFDPGVSSDGSDGSGLGLYIVQRMVDSHGWEIETEEAGEAGGIRRDGDGLAGTAFEITWGG